LSTVHCPQSTAHCPLPTAHSPLSITHCPLSTVHCPQSTAHCPLPTAHSPLSITRCPLSTVHCPQSIAPCPLSTVHSPVYADSDQIKDGRRTARHVHRYVEVAHEAGESPRPVDLQQKDFYCSELQGNPGVPMNCVAEEDKRRERRTKAIPIVSK